MYFLKLLLFLATIDILEYFSSPEPNLTSHPALLLTKADTMWHITRVVQVCIIRKLIKSWTNIPSLTKNIQQCLSVKHAY